jgi:hypothetical protein
MFWFCDASAMDGRLPVFVARAIKKPSESVLRARIELFIASASSLRSEIEYIVGVPP